MAALAGVLASLTVFAGHASATVIHRTYEFTASGFYSSDVPGGVPPVDPVTGSFTLQFDTAASSINASTGLTINSLNLPNTALTYTYVSSVDSLIIGAGQANSPEESAHDFWIQLFGVSGALSGVHAVGVDYTTAGAGSGFFSQPYLWQARNSSVHAFEGSADVPEPATWTMMIGGLALAGAALRNRPGRRSVSPAGSR